MFLSLHSWLLWHKMVCVRLIQALVGGCVGYSHCCRGLLVQTLHSALTYSVIDRRLGSFQSLTSMNIMPFTSQGVDLHPLHPHSLFAYIPRSANLGHSVQMFSIGKNGQFSRCFSSNSLHPIEAEVVSDPLVTWA